MREYREQYLDEALTTETITDIVSGENIICTGDNVKKILIDRYGERKVYGRVGADDHTWYENGGISAAWNFFITNRQKDIDVLYRSLYADYNPIENYNMSEKTQTTDRGTTTNDLTDTTSREGTHSTSGIDTHNLTDTLTQTGTVTTEGTTEGKTTDSTTQTTNNTGTVQDNAAISNIQRVKAYDSSDMSDRESNTGNNTNTRTDNTQQAITHGGDIDSNVIANTTVTNNLTDTTTHGGTIEKSDTLTINTTDTTTHGGTVGYDNTIITDHSRSGNIGVTSTQQLIESEIKLRVLNNITNYVIELFVNSYTVW